MTARTSQPRFTGYHMAAIMVSFFGVVIAVNFTMAWYATSSWSGLVVENTYVASQQFNSRAAAMRAATPGPKNPAGAILRGFR